MQITQHEEEEILVFAIELLQSQKNIKESVVLASHTTFRHLLHILLQHYAAFRMRIVVQDYCTINPHRKLINKVMLFLFQNILLLEVYDFFWFAMPEHLFLSLLILD